MQQFNTNMSETIINIIRGYILSNRAYVVIGFLSLHISFYIDYKVVFHVLFLLFSYWCKIVFWVSVWENQFILRSDKNKLLLVFHLCIVPWVFLMFSVAIPRILRPSVTNNCFLVFTQNVSINIKHTWNIIVVHVLP